LIGKRAPKPSATYSIRVTLVPSSARFATNPAIGQHEGDRGARSAFRQRGAFNVGVESAAMRMRLGIRSSEQEPFCPAYVLAGAAWQDQGAPHVTLKTTIRRPPDTRQPRRSSLCKPRAL